MAENVDPTVVLPEVCVDLANVDSFFDIFYRIETATSNLVDDTGSRVRPDRDDLIAATLAAKSLLDSNPNPTTRISITIKLKFKKWQLEITIGW